MRHKRVGLSAALTGTLLASMVLACGAFADGGATIAVAPRVTYGLQSFGNTTTAPPDTNRIYSSYWLLPVFAGDRFVIDWQGPPPDGFGTDSLLLYPAGTTDYTVENTQWIDESDIGSNGSAQLSYTANTTGVMPLRFYADESHEAGPYNFTAYVTHAMTAAVQTVSTDRRAHRTNFRISLHNPDGVALSPSGVGASVQVLLNSRWSTVGKVHSLAFTIAWSRATRGHREKVRVRVSAPTYAQTYSRAIAAQAF